MVDFRARSSNCSFTPHMATVVGAGLVQRNFWFPHEGAGAPGLGPFPATFPGTLTESRIRNGAGRTQTVPLWDASMAECWLTMPSCWL